MMDLTFYKYDFEKIKNILKDIQFLKLIIYIKVLYIQWDYQNPV